MAASRRKCSRVYNSTERLVWNGDYPYSRRRGSYLSSTMGLYHTLMIAHTLHTFAQWATRWRGQRYYDALYAEMHKANMFQGDTWRAHLQQLRDAIPDVDSRTILDFGCGPKGGL